jgi:hypothetical protein
MSITTQAPHSNAPRLRRVNVEGLKGTYVVNLHNVARLGLTKDGTEVVLGGFYFNHTSPGSNPAQLLVDESPEELLDGQTDLSFVQTSTVIGRRPIFVNLAHVTEIHAVPDGTRIAFTGFGFDYSGAPVDDFVIVADPPDYFVKD